MKRASKNLAIVFACVAVGFFGIQFPGSNSIVRAYAPPSVPGESYQICDQTAQYLTSPWTYDALASGGQTYTVAQYEALTGYGTTLPPLPTYISNEAPTATAAVIYAPNQSIDNPAYFYPDSPILYFFEGGSYGSIGLQSVSGDEFIGGSAPGFPEPHFNDGGGAAGIGSSNDTFGFSGGSTTLTAGAAQNATVVDVSSQLPNYSSWITFSDGSTYGIQSFTSNTVTLSSPLTSAESNNSTAWANSNPPIATAASSAGQGVTSLTLNASSIPLIKWGDYAIGADSYEITGVSGSQSGYTLTTPGLDTAVAANTPIYYDILAGGVSVEYLDINDDVHNTTGTITLGGGWIVEHNNIHDGYNASAGNGVAFYGGDESTLEYNCFARMGDYGAGGSGKNQIFDYNEVEQSAYRGDPGCGCSGGGKWWGTLNADIIDNSFVEDGIGGGQADIWLDNGNAGTDIEGNYFYKDAGSSITNETGFNMKVAGNLFLDDGWGDGTGASSNSDGAVNVNSSGGINIPGSRFENQLLITGNYFVNDWEGITIWQSTQRSCLSSGEGWPIDSAYCSGGFPTTAETAAGGSYYFSHQGDSAHGGYRNLAQAGSIGNSTVLLNGSEAINDQIGIGDPISVTTPDRTNVSTFTGTGTISVANSSSFPSSGELRVDTSAANGGGGFTGAILSYTGNTGTGFTGVNKLSGTGTLTGTVLQVQKYMVTGETCYSNDCAVSISPSLATNVSSGTEISNAGTCPLFADSTALPSGPKAPAPSNVSYWDGCQWQSRNVSVSSNTFIFQPSVIANSAPPIGNATTTQCTLVKNCGTNFMAFQNGGQAPYYDDTGMNGMFSDSSFTGCPNWDPGCSSDPLTNLNAGSNPPGAPVGNGETPYNNDWSGNSYAGPWEMSDAYSFSGCNPLPADGVNSMPNSDCGTIDIPTWQGAWQQDQGSTYTPIAVSLGSPTANQEIAGPAQSVTEYADSKTAVTGTLTLNGATVGSGAITSPHNWSLNTLNYADGTYTLGVKGTDTGANSATDSASVYVSNGDINGDGVINLSDLAVLAGHYGQTDPNYSDGNITGASTINISDLAILAANWGWSHP